MMLASSILLYTHFTFIQQRMSCIIFRQFKQLYLKNFNGVFCIRLPWRSDRMSSCRHKRRSDYSKRKSKQWILRSCPAVKRLRTLHSSERRSRSSRSASGRNTRRSWTRLSASGPKSKRARLKLTDINSSCWSRGTSWLPWPVDWTRGMRQSYSCKKSLMPMTGLL